MTTPINTTLPTSQETPTIEPVMLFCPSCDKQHVDEGRWATKPHRTHRCVDDSMGLGCGIEWTLERYTVGIPYGTSKSPYITELHKNSLTGNDPRDHYGEWRRQMIPRPNCCEAAQKVPLVIWNTKEIDGGRCRFQWGRSPLNYETMDNFLAVKDWDDLIKFSEVFFCPFCGTRLPRMRRKQPHPRSVAVWADNGFSCGACNESSRNCTCALMSAGWEIDPNQ